MYALALTNAAALKAFIVQYPKIQIQGYSPDFPDELFYLYRDVYDLNKDLGIAVANEMALAYILDKYNAGVALLKQDENGNFQKINTTANTDGNGNTTYTKTDCP